MTADASFNVVGFVSNQIIRTTVININWQAG